MFDIVHAKTKSIFIKFTVSLSQLIAYVNLHVHLILKIDINYKNMYTYIYYI